METIHFLACTNNTPSAQPLRPPRLSAGKYPDAPAGASTKSGNNIVQHSFCTNNI